MARCRASSVRTGAGHGSSARASTASLSSINSIPAKSERASLRRRSAIWRAWRRFQSIRASGSPSVPSPRRPRRVLWVRPIGMRVRPSCRRKSPAVFPILVELGHELFEGKPRDRLRLWRPIRTPYRRSDPAFADAAFSPRSRLGSRRHDFGHRSAAIGDDDGFAGRDRPHIFAQLVFQNLQPNGAHEAKVASGGDLVNSRHPLSARAASRRASRRPRRCPDWSQISAGRGKQPTWATPPWSFAGPPSAASARPWRSRRDRL